VRHENTHAQASLRIATRTVRCGAAALVSSQTDPRLPADLLLTGNSTAKARSKSPPSWGGEGGGLSKPLLPPEMAKVERHAYRVPGTGFPHYLADSHLKLCKSS
jgi:hypothetical protein